MFKKKHLTLLFLQASKEKLEPSGFDFAFSDMRKVIRFNFLSPSTLYFLTFANIIWALMPKF